ncbi:MAG TPA: hypothetical protein VNY24_17835 [Candidatus Acidoferrales bacterium]|jgi:hypothetical protein|nr:hypothetical protein [Candidatus Acidoferrales bacterium]
MMIDKTLTNDAWRRIFEELPVKERIAELGSFRLTAKQIHKIAKREPRLMTKFDSREQRPKLLLQPPLTILPTTNGEYVLLRGDGYLDVPPTQTVETYDASKVARLQTIKWSEGIRSEPQALDTLFMASALRSFADDDTLQLTIRGRLRSGKFDFKFRTDIKEELISVSGVQVEVDSGYEGRKVVIVEAKFGALKSFIVRQLYYPYRDLLSNGVSKEIVPILLVYSNRVYSLYSFKFQRPDEYQSISLVRQAHYTLEDLKTLPRLAEFVTSTRRKPPTGIPFPQADDLSKVLDVADILSGGLADKEEIAERFQVDPRQGDYYANAAAWLGIAEKSKGSFDLTKEGREFNKLTRIERMERVADILAQTPGFAEALAAQAGGNPLNLAEIARAIGKNYGLSGTTAPRRASTVRSWIEYLAGNFRN